MTLLMKRLGITFCLFELLRYLWEISYYRDMNTWPPSLYYFVFLVNRMAPPKLWVWFLCVGCLVYRCHGNVPTPVDPILVIEGDPYVLVLFDFHTHVDPGGSCTDLYPRTLEMMWSLRWIHGVQRSNPPNSVGKSLCLRIWKSWWE